MTIFHASKRYAAALFWLTAISPALILGGSASILPQDRSTTNLRVNDLQYLGTHNSFRLAHHPAERTVFERFNSPRRIMRLQYAHPSLLDQLNMGVRKFELDVWKDDTGALFESPILLQLARGEGADVPDPLLPEEHHRPGYKVLHTKEDDYRSSCRLLTRCLEEIAAWSLSHPGHLPIFISLQLKQGEPGQPYLLSHPGYGPPERFGSQDLDQIDVLVREAFADRLLTPDEMRGYHPSPRDAALADDWPLLSEAKGRVFVMLHESGSDEPIHPTTRLYLQHSPKLHGRAMFVLALNPERADAAFVNVRGPLPFRSKVSRLVALGFVVRQRSDIDALDALSCDKRMREEALQSGTQLVSTDHLTSPTYAPCEFSVEIPGPGIARCSPGRPRCRGIAYEPFF